MAAKEKQHTCNKCKSIRYARFMQPIPGSKHWACIDCDSNPKSPSFLPPGWVALQVTYTPPFKNKNDGSQT